MFGNIFRKVMDLKIAEIFGFCLNLLGEVWISLVVGMQRYSIYDNWFKVGDKITIQMNGFANVNRHSIDILPECIIPYLKKDPNSRFSTTHGFVYDISEYPATRGLKGRLIFHFPTE